MGETKHRKAPRLRVALSVQVVGAPQSVLLTTVDVSRDGLFLHSTDPRPVRHLLRLRIDVGDGREPIQGHGVVVRAVDEEEAGRTGSERGMGVEFYGFGGEPRRRWEEFLGQLAAEPGVVARTSAPRRAPRELQPVSCDAAHKMPGRSHILLLLGVTNVEQLHEICDHHLPAGVVVVDTSAHLPVGAAVDLRLTHPLSREVYDLHGTVRRAVERPPGLVVALTPGVSTRQEELRRFIDAGLPEEELSLEVLDDSHE